MHPITIRRRMKVESLSCFVHFLVSYSSLSAPSPQHVRLGSLDFSALLRFISADRTGDHVSLTVLCSDHSERPDKGAIFLFSLLNIAAKSGAPARAVVGRLPGNEGWSLSRVREVDCLKDLSVFFSPTKAESFNHPFLPILETFSIEDLPPVGLKSPPFSCFSTCTRIAIEDMSISLYWCPALYAATSLIVTPKKTPLHFLHPLPGMRDSSATRRRRGVGTLR
mmetsp:Transcript_15352/g.24303  ORF Transcript_15352/g.24303 Transcript_15352/m.24303 type:complete len:223 (+) Transcript_15352:1609-2277(+)